MGKKMGARECCGFGVLFRFLFAFIIFAAPWSFAQSCPTTHVWPQPSSSNTGQIFYVDCSQHDFLSDGSTLQPCEWVGQLKTVAGHEYVCTVVDEYAKRSLGQIQHSDSNAGSASGIACTNEGRNYAILMQGSSSGSGNYLTFDPNTAWEDFTIKTRLS
jgi:hypothetical protein